MDGKAKEIWDRVTENQAKLKGCNKHDFRRELGASHRYKCENCGGEVDSSAAHYYKLGLQHGSEAVLNKKNTFVISAFPGCGKSYCFGAYKDRFDMLDSDSSHFSWVKDEAGNNTSERNPDFPNNYIEHIKSNIGKVDIIFVSSHDNVRKALNEAGIKVVMVSPKPEMKDIWLDRFGKRGNDEKFITFIGNNWDKFIKEIEEEMYDNIQLKLVLDEGMPYITLEILEALVDRCKQFAN